VSIFDSFMIEEMVKVNQDIEKLLGKNRALEFALSELMQEYEEVIHSEFATSSNPKPWTKSENWQRAYKLIHAEDVPEEAA
jgi:hypothetical protein